MCYKEDRLLKGKLKLEVDPTAEPLKLPQRAAPVALYIQHREEQQVNSKEGSHHQRKEQ